MAGFPANNFAVYRISGRISGIRPDIRLKSKYRIFVKKYIEFFSFQQNLPTFLVAISLLFYTYVVKSSEKICSFEVRIICLTVSPDIRPDIRLSGQPDIRQMKPDIRPDTGYKKGRISGQPVIRYNPITFSPLFLISLC